MSRQNLTAVRSQSGFTLVELAIVMIIIGLLIGGVLKGQELIGNAQVTATIAQLKGIEAATTTFRDTYNGTPGDLASADTRLANCTAVPCLPGAGTLGDGNITSPFTAAPTAEGSAFFPQLSAANLVTGIVPTAASTTFGQNFPSSKISGNGILVSTVGAPATGTLPGAAAVIGVPGGLFFAVTNAVAAVAAGTANLKPTEASRIDTKMDDSVPNTGVIVAFGAASGATGCATAATAVAGYNTSLNTNICGVYYHAQN